MDKQLITGEAIAPRKPGFGRQHEDQRQPHCRHELSLEIASKGLTTRIQMKKEDARTKKRCCARGSLCCALQRLERVWATLGHLWLWPACSHQHRYVRAALHPGWEGRARQLARKKPSGYLALCWAEVEGGYLRFRDLGDILTCFLICQAAGICGIMEVALNRGFSAYGVLTAIVKGNSVRNCLPLSLT